MAKFIHLTDTHLGRKNFKLKERERDYFETFKQTINKSIELKVDFLVHSGDLFDKSEPETEIIINVMRILKDLKKAKIPLFIIPGNHDLGVGETVINLLDESNYLINVASKKYREIKDGKVIIKGESYKNCYIAGIDGRRQLNEIKQILENSVIKHDEENYKIFLFHHTISDLGEIYSDFPTNLLPKGFDYYAAGHWHQQKEFKYDNSDLIYVGSTEYFDIHDMEQTEKKRIMLVDTLTKQITPIYLKTREIKLVKIKSEKETIQELNQKILDNIKKPETRNPLLIIKIKGKLKSGRKIHINKYEINKKSRELGYLNTRIDSTKLENPETIKSHKKNVIGIEKEYFEKKGYKKKDIEKIITILNTYSEKQNFNELNEKTEKLLLE